MRYSPEFFIQVLKSIQSKLLEVPEDARFRIRGELKATKLIASQVFPCVLNVGKLDGNTILWVQLGEQSKDWMIKEITEVPEFLRSVTGDLPEAQIAQGIVYVKTAEKQDKWIIDNLIWEFIMQIIRNSAVKINAEWEEREKSIFESIGFREWSINPVPENLIPCPQIAALVHPTEDGRIVKYAFRDLMNDVNRTKLLTCVPDNVFDVLNRAVILYLYGYQEWEFFTMSQHVSVSTIETNFTTMYCHLLRKPVVMELKPKGSPKNHCVVSVELPEIKTYGEFKAQEFWMGRETDLSYQVVRVNGEPIRKLRHPDPQKSIQYLFEKREILAPGESLDLEYLLEKRNYFSHPYGTHIDMIGEAYAVLSEVVTLINRTWMRFLHADKMIWENVWSNPPHWAQRQ